jgi:hypothetical protein
MEELFLIAHKVRGQLAFDIAQRWLLSNGRALWLIPTSGDRAYPLRWMRLDESLALTLSAEELAGVTDHYAYLEERKSLVARLLAWWRRPRLSVADALDISWSAACAGEGERGLRKLRVKFLDPTMSA